MGSRHEEAHAATSGARGSGLVPQPGSQASFAVVGSRAGYADGPERGACHEDVRGFRQDPQGHRPRPRVLGAAEVDDNGTGSTSAGTIGCLCTRQPQAEPDAREANSNPQNCSCSNRHLDF